MAHKTTFVSIFIVSILSGCAVQKAQGLATYKNAVTYYEAKKYAKAARLFEDALPLIQGKQEAINAHFFLAYCRFHLKDYVESADRFQYFYRTFLRDPRKQEALYRQGEALYFVSPDERLDQKITQEAVQALQTYEDQYPAGTHSEQVATYLNTLIAKLARKAFRNAQLYHQLTHYKAAVVALNNFQQDFPESVWGEQAAYLKADAQHRFAQTALATEQRRQLVTALRYCHEFLERYPDSKEASKAKKIYEHCLSSIDKLAPNP